MIRLPHPNFTLVFQQLAGNHQALNFAGAFADGAQLYIAIKLFGGIVFDKTVAAMNLDSFVGALYGDFAGVELCHGGLLCRLHAGIFH
jgi:hypothetical protein